MIKRILDDSKVKSFVDIAEVKKWQGKVTEAHKKIHERTGEGSEFLGWVDWPINYDKEEFGRIKIAAEKISNDSEVLVVIGIGGSYLGARAVNEALAGDKKVDILYAGNNLSSRQMQEVLEQIEGKEVSLNVISKSGTTTEPGLAFRILRQWMEEKYGDEAGKRIYATTDKKKGALKNLADQKGYETFVVPDDIGGRYSVLTAVGMLPIAVAGIDVEGLMAGAAEARSNYLTDDLDKNDAYTYAVYRNILYKQGKQIEILANYEPCLHFVGEWWKQLFGESEGKDKKGIFPASVDLTTDLHSLGQFIQNGNRNLLETVLKIEEDKIGIKIRRQEDDSDGLNYLEGKTLEEVNKVAMEATKLAHVSGGVPVLGIDLPKLDAGTLGYLIYFWEKACAMSGYLLGVNPFDQPGVEEYKNRMFKGLGKPGY